MNCKICNSDVPDSSLLPDMCQACITKATGIMHTSTAPTHALGDKVATAAKALGFRQTPGCGCGDRQKALNRLNLKAPALEVARGLLTAIINPPKDEK